ncbi:MAG: single-stranded-DNA-specific exonuclease RecJ [Gaiellaceae bacterium]
MQQGSWTIETVATRDVRELARELELSELTASVLVRRGLTDGERARAFLATEAPAHDPFALGDMAEAVQRIRAAVAAGEKICVHGDYDVDGVSATALAVILLRELGAEVSWALPSRFDEGYGLTPGMLERLAGDGCSLVITVDCGITAVEEVAKAAELGLEVIVTDHHRPGERLPDCPIVAPRPSSYPFAGLCGTGVVYKLGEALFGADSEFLLDQLDLVCLATVADVVPLVDENRWLVTAGLRKLGRTSRPGLRALMRSAGVDPATIDTGQIAFRLAPRINAAGRLGHPGLALELLLGGDEQEAALQTRKLEELNRERQAVEDRIQREAVQEVESWPEAKRRRRAYVIAREDWHEGVIGIVASRLVERFSRPVVLVAGSDGDWKGSGRSIPAYDLHGGIVACSSLLERFGGHRAAAGFSIRPEKLEEFSEAFTAHASEALSDADLMPVAKVDAIVPPQTKLTLELCRELERTASGAPVATTSPSDWRRIAGTAPSRRSCRSGGSSTSHRATKSCATSSPPVGARERKAGTSRRARSSPRRDCSTMAPAGAACSSRQLSARSSRTTSRSRPPPRAQARLLPRSSVSSSSSRMGMSLRPSSGISGLIRRDFSIAPRRRAVSVKPRR